MRRLNVDELGVHLQTMKRVFVGIMILVLLLPATSAQTPTAAVSISCDEILENVPIGNVTILCTVTNPTAYIEKVSISVAGGILSVSHPGDVLVESGQDVEFHVNGTLGSSDSFHQLTEVELEISATVTEMNGVPPINVATSESVVDLNNSASLVQCTSFSGSWGTTVSLLFAYTNASGVQKSSQQVVIGLNDDAAPLHVENFLLHAVNGCYDDSTFHRVIDDFMIQGGDFQNSDGTGGYAAEWFGYCDGVQQADSSACSPTSYTLPDESSNGLLHEPCTISMAKSSNPNTGGSQFFIVPEDSTPSWLDGVHTVFGSIYAGCDVITEISASNTDSSDRPVSPVVLEAIIPDCDGDGTPDWRDDAYPTVRLPWMFCSHLVQDDDDDGFENDFDAFPYDPTEWNDTDMDGVGDNSDGFPEDPSEWTDSDMDGVGDNSDAFPNDANETTDSDGDGVGDNADAFPDDANETEDSDGDGVGDESDYAPKDPDVTSKDDLIGEATPGFSMLAALLACSLAIVLPRRRND